MVRSQAPISNGPRKSSSDTKRASASATTRFAPLEPLSAQTQAELQARTMSRNLVSPIYRGNSRRQMYRDQHLSKNVLPSSLPDDGRVWLLVPYAEKDQAKRAGARWDQKLKCWYTTRGPNLARLMRWLPKEKK